MFPLEFPLAILAKHKQARLVLDPFCGRGTTLYAARHHGIRAVGIDCSPVAVAISKAKLASFSVEKPLTLAKRILETGDALDVPEGPFWRLAFHPNTLRDICRLRTGLLQVRDSDSAVLLRAAVLGVLHGPTTKVRSYLSNQMQRTFSPKPDYAVRFWKERNLKPLYVDVLAALQRKLERIASGEYTVISRGWRDVHSGDSAQASSFHAVPSGVDLVITSPPYYGMRTYVPDQWLRNWFLGGPAHVDYSDPGDLPSSSPADFAKALGRTWANAVSKRSDDFRLFVRFGVIPSRVVNARRLLLDSLDESGQRWKVISMRNAHTADAGKRQVGQMRTHTDAVGEFDLHAALA